METDEVLAKVKSLSRAPRACSFYHVDLHVHSPASSDYHGDREVSPHAFVSAFVNRGIDMIAITDHNTGTYVDKAIEARDEIAAQEGKNITVLPGVELYVSPGIHLLAILPEGGSAAISDLLSLLELPVEQHGDTTKLIPKTIGDISRIVHDRRGLLIGAHCNSSNGIVDKLDGQTRLEWLGAVDALEVNSGTADEKLAKTMAFVTSALGVEIPFTFGSDSHNSADDTKGMLVKMAEPSFTSLQQLTFEPQLRVKRTEPASTSHARIVGFTTTHGIYADERFRFSPHLNVLLGGRGAGKSAAIDLLRFAFQAEPTIDDVRMKLFSSRIMAFLQSVGEVLVLVVGTDGETYLIRRSGAYEKERGLAIFQEDATVFQVVDKGLVQRELRPLEVLGVEFYGQGEAALLSNLTTDQLRLIDENLDHSDAAASATAAEEDLLADEIQLSKHRQKLEDLLVEAAKRPLLEERRGSLKTFLADPIFSERTRWDRERTWLTSHQEWIHDLLSSLPSALSPPTAADIDIDASPVKATLENVRKISATVLIDSQSDLSQFRQRLADAASDLKGCETAWSSAYEAADKEYRERLSHLGAANLAEAAEDLREIEKALDQLTNSVDPAIGRIHEDMESLSKGRSALLDQLNAARSSIAESRNSFVQELNSQLGGEVLLELDGYDTSIFFRAVDEPLQGSGMHRREEQVALVCNSLEPAVFAGIVRAKSVDKLSVIGVTDSNASKIVNILNEDTVQKIERVEVPPYPKISIKREGEEDYTDIRSLSVGEKCSAILSIALLSKRKPLVIDQPEDDLDHAFIINSIVEGIRAAKPERQIIAATHNPNIPVLGDARWSSEWPAKLGRMSAVYRTQGASNYPTSRRKFRGLKAGLKPSSGVAEGTQGYLGGRLDTPFLGAGPVVFELTPGEHGEDEDHVGPGPGIPEVAERQGGHADNDE